MAEQDYQVTDAATGQVMSGTWNPETVPAEDFFSVVGRFAENQGIEGSVPNWRESRYFSDPNAYHAFKDLGHSISDYFSSGAFRESSQGKNWFGLSDEDRELEIYHAGQRIQHTYKGDPEASDPEMTGTAQTYFTASGIARFEAEKRLGKTPGVDLY